ncbi:MAG: endo-1,4-beta-xylanase [Candidatus Binatia bacterium]|nr:endo-1,4-beta-xylanase [Candidatus Binatia bacterium]
MHASTVIVRPPRRVQSGSVGVVALLALLVGLAPSVADGAACGLARRACLSAARADAHACRSDCSGVADRARRAACRATCADLQAQVRADCRRVNDTCAAVCGETHVDAQGCTQQIRACRSDARDAHGVCRTSCRSKPFLAERKRCRRDCSEARAEGERACGFATAVGVTGDVSMPDFAPGVPGDLSLLTDAERAAIADADARVPGLRTRSLRISSPPGTVVELTQVRHAFDFGLALDTAKFVGKEEELDFFLGSAAANHVSIAVTESSAKWNRVEPEMGVRDFSLADMDVATAQDFGYRVKGHTLNWGITPPFSSSGAPAWAFERYEQLPLSPELEAELRDVLRAHVEAMVTRYRDDIEIWDVTNETLQPLAQWTIQRLGPGIVEDLFRWAHAADPDCLLVFNEWIVEVFTGFPAPTAADVRDRVVGLRAAGVPIHAVGQQAHFAPTLAFGGIEVDLSGRTPIDEYAIALDTLAEAGLPIHLSETNFIAPDDPELRAAHAEGLMRLWWGHPSVEQIVFWGLWNKVAGRDEFDVGFWDDDRNISRHGAAVFSLLNDRWRTELTGTTDANGFLETSATHGDYVARWEEEGTPVHARFSVRPGVGTLNVVLVGP